MRIAKSLLCLGILFSFISINAQEFELGKVSVKELEEKYHPNDSSAVAAVLYAKGRTYFNYSEASGFTVMTEVETRIKIYKKEGYDWANKSIEYYTGSNPFEKVNFTKAVTYNLVDGKIEKSKLKSDGEFSEKLNKFWSSEKITMPNVKEGAIIEYRYVIESPYDNTFPEWKFQSTIPVNYTEYQTEIPEYYGYNMFFKGSLSPVITKDVQARSIQLSSKERSGHMTVTTSHTKSTIDFQASIAKYVLKDVPAIKEEAYVNNIDNYSSSIYHEKSLTKFPNSMVKVYSADWASIVKTIYDNDNFGAELNRKGYFEDDLNATIAGITDRNKKMYAIFQFVKARMNWNNYLGYSCNDGVKSAYKNKTGNIAEINLMLAAMLQSNGFQARPVLVSTRSNGVAVFPNKSGYNYVIVAVEDNDKIILLDASDKNALPNQVPFRALNWFGRLIREDGSSTNVDLMPTMVSKENIAMNYTISATGEISGKLRRIYTDYNAQIFRNRHVGTKEEQYLENLESNMNKIEISEYVRDNANQVEEPISETFSFKGGDFCDVVGDKIYVSPLLFFTTKKNPFNQEKREYPVDFGFPWQDKYAINIEIPEGYAVETLPSVTSIQTAQNIFGFKYNIVASGNKIQIAITQDIMVPIVNPADYQTLQESYKKMIEKQTEKIVLKKI